MSFANPTPIRLGMSGTLAGKRYRVAGRMVMGMDDEGETYYWNEFNLVGEEDDSATLVYEETERGGEWRLFTMFEPDHPMTAADAATRHVGDQLDLEGRDVRVTLVDESRVYHIEGEAPEGVEVGDIAHYFNAETGSRMLVVSWTGDEVEYYRGASISAGAVAAAFGVRPVSFTGGFLSVRAAETGVADSGKALRIVGAFLFMVIVFAAFVTLGPKWRRNTVAKIGAPAAPLRVGSTGQLEGKTWRITGHAVVEVAEVGRIFDRHEYQLANDEENRALLVCGLKPREKAWVLFTRLQPINALSPQEAAALRVGQTINLDGYVAPISELFQSVVPQGENSSSPDAKNGTVQFGFVAQSGPTPLLVRWDASSIVFLRGTVFPSKEIVVALSSAKY